MTSTLIDQSSLVYLVALDLEDGDQVARVQFKESMIDPDLFDGFVKAVVIFAKTRVDIIRKGGYDILIEVGGTMLVILAIQSADDNHDPYRQRMRQILRLAEAFSFHAFPPSDSVRQLAEFIHKLPVWMQHYWVNYLLARLDLGWVGILDANPSEFIDSLLRSYKHGQPLSDRDEFLLRRIIPALCFQIDSRGITIGLDVQSMTRFRELARRIDTVLEHRFSEIDGLALHLKGLVVNLEPLWLTAYGHQILKALNLGLVCSLDAFSRIHDHFKSLGIDLWITREESTAHTHGLSSELREYVLKRMDPVHTPLSYPRNEVLSVTLRGMLA